MSKSSNEVSYKIKNRKCHDCGKPTSNYRCDNCLSEWRIANNVVMGALEFTPSTAASQKGKNYD